MAKPPTDAAPPSSDGPTTHVLPDLLQPGLALVFCGTAAGHRSAAEGAYYAHPGNQFWPALQQAGLTPRRLMPAEFPQLLTLRIGLTDLAKHHVGNDAELPGDAFDAAALRAKIQHYAPQLLAFTSKTAAQAAGLRVRQLGLQAESWGTTRLFVLPSPSGQARRYWDLMPWRALGRHYRQALRTAMDVHPS